jgi:riboflavin kinase / FMN adenylyltransferase
MQLLHGIHGLKQLPAGVVLSVGNFDGVHRGHERILETAHRFRTDAGVAVVTFEPHPMTVLRPDRAPPRLSPLKIKELLLEPRGVDYLVVLPPEPQVLNLTAEAFWQILRDDVRPSHMIEGESFNFGKGRGGTIDRLREWAAISDVKLHVIGPVSVVLLDLQIVTVSSSLIRWLLQNGRVRDAAICLGHPYILQGQVIKGFQRGRTIGVPTANLDCGEQLIPAEGVYIGRSTVDGVTYPAAISIGTMPTFGDNPPQLEVHLIGYDGDLYGQTLTVEMIDWLRDQWKFSDVEQLKRKIEQDLAQVQRRSGDDPSRLIAQMEATAHG